MSNNLSQWILLLGLLVSLSLASHHHYHHHKRHHHHHHAHHRSNVTKGAQRPSSYPDDEHSLRNIQMQDLIEDDDEFFNKLKKEKAMVIPTVLSDAGPKAANMADLEIEHLAEQIPEFKDKTVAKYFKKSYREGDIESTEDFKAIISGNLSPQDLEELRKKLKWQVTKDEHGKPMVKIPFLVRNLGKQAIESINQAIEDLKRFTCIRLTPREKEDKDYVQFLPSKKGCTSHFGRQTGAQRIGLGAGCEYKGTVLHEVMHTLGFLHECTRPDRNRYIRVNFDKVEEGRKRNFKTYDHKIITDYDGQYDPFSIMHCNHHAFNEDREDETIESLLPNIPNKILGQRLGLTALDVMKINQAYCRTTPEVIVQPSLQLQQPPSIVLDIPQRDEMASTTTTTTTTPPTTTSTSTTTTTLTTTTPTTTTSTSTSTTPTTTTTTTTPFFIPPILLPLLFPTTTTTTSTTTTLVPGQEIEDDPIDPNSDDPVTTTTTAEPLSELDQATTTTTETPRIVIQFPLLTSCIPNPLCVTPPCNAQPCLQQPSPPQPQVVQPSQPSDESCDKPPCETKDSECNSPYPCWPQNFEWSNVGFPQSCDCHNDNLSSSAPPPGPPISIIPDNAPENDKKCQLCRCTPMKSTQTPRVWSNNHFCHPSKKKDPKFQLLRSGFVPGKRCLLIDESKEWDNLHLCFDKAAPYDLMWSTVDQLKENGKSRCLKMEEPQDWVWNKKYLCDKNSI